MTDTTHTVIRNGGNVEDSLDGVGLGGMELASQARGGTKVDDVDVFFPWPMLGCLRKQQSNLMSNAGEGICQFTAKLTGGVIGETANLIQRFNCWSGCYKAVHSAKVYLLWVNIQ